MKPSPLFNFRTFLSLQYEICTIGWPSTPTVSPLATDLSCLWVFLLEKFSSHKMRMCVGFLFVWFFCNWLSSLSKLFPKVINIIAVDASLWGLSGVPQYGHITVCASAVVPVSCLLQTVVLWTDPCTHLSICVWIMFSCGLGVAGSWGSFILHPYHQYTCLHIIANTWIIQVLKITAMPVETHTTLLCFLINMFMRQLWNSKSL